MKPIAARLGALLAGLCLVSVTSLSSGEDKVERILNELPENMEQNLIDPITVDKNPSFAGGEHLEYKLGWSFFTVAHAEITVKPEEYEGKPALSIRLDTKTNPFADAFYRVRNHTLSWVARDLSRSFEYRARQSEAERERDIVARFDAEDLVGRYHNMKDDSYREPVDILPGTFDPLGIVFFIRSLEFDVGDELVVPTSNGKEFFFTVVRVVDKVERKFLTGKHEAYILEPDIKDLGGVFKKSPDGKIRFFISADESKVPLRMESEVAVGKFWSELKQLPGGKSS